ncbi:hypothetical protein MKX01_026948 [Papaver californicum]|nr:hypothetical protein MKX01_026948 [Papaver californicum]
MFHYSLLFLLLVSPFSLILSVNQEGLYLQQVRLSLDDPNGIISNWDERDDNPCNWKGITCDSATQSVNSVDLSNANLAGNFPTPICNLQSLTFLSLFNNSINSSLPLEISKCQNLQHLNLAENLFVGSIPYTLAGITTLRHLDLAGNNFTGEIPPSFGKFSQLEVLSLVENLLNGTIPSFLGNISSLKQLNLSYNPFSPSQLAPELGNLRNLEILWLTNCNLIGQVPDSLGKLGDLIDLDLAVNNLNGPIPKSVTELTNAVQIELYNNSLTGEIPVGFSKIKSLKRFDASANELVGRIPDDLCELHLESLNLYENQLEGNLPGTITQSPNLNELRLFNNKLTGKLPKDLGKNAPLKFIDVSGNQFSGEIPAGLCENGVLEEILFINNSFSGKIPESLGKCLSLTRVRMRDNSLSGDIPSAFWGLPNVNLMELMGNSFSGLIPNTISGASSLSILLISRNQFTGVIPDEIGVLQNLVEFSGSDNLLTGPLPKALVNLSKLGRLDLHGNQLSGEIPSGIRSWKNLNELNLASNGFSGNIPTELGSLPVLNYLDLSDNHFSGNIPLELQNLKLNEFNLSNNRLTGELPPSFAVQMYRTSFLGNPGLCGDLSGLCPTGVEAKKIGFAWLLRSIFILAFIIFVVGVFWFYYKYRNFKKAKTGIEKTKWTLTSFHKLGFSEYEILDCLDEDNVIGSGASGKVYKAVLSNGEIVAVKKLWGELNRESSVLEDVEKGWIPDDGFEAEVETLGKIRHKNIVRLWCCCAAKDSKLLVYEYMPNGSLGDLLHSNKGGLLDWLTRYKIAVDAAEGLSYLHHDCVPPIVHRDVKSNNILLDGEFRARVSDFGVAKTVDAIGKGNEPMSVIAGSYGYIAPEYAYTLRVNEKSDIYSFGVVILELVTGRLPNDPEFREKDLVKWVYSTVDKKGVDHVIDSKLDSCFKDEISMVLNIGIICTSPLPINRPSMRRVVTMLQEVGIENRVIAENKDGKTSPYYYEKEASV